MELVACQCVPIREVSSFEDCVQASMELVARRCVPIREVSSFQRVLCTFCTSNQCLNEFS